MANWTIKDGDFCFVEIPVPDREQAKQFYSALFGWQYDDIPGLDYTMVKTSEDGVLGGFGKLFEQTQGPVVSVKVSGDMGEFLEKVKAAGGEVVVDELSLGDYGSTALIKDPAGNLVGLSKDPD